jgi:hypothetical protein
MRRRLSPSKEASPPTVPLHTHSPPFDSNRASPNLGAALHRSRHSSANRWSCVLLEELESHLLVLMRPRVSVVAFLQWVCPLISTGLAPVTGRETTHVRPTQGDVGSSPQRSLEPLPTAVDHAVNFSLFMP